MNIKFFGFYVTLLLLTLNGLEVYANSGKGADNIVINRLDNKWSYLYNNEERPYFAGYTSSDHIFQEINFHRYKKYNLNLTASPDLSLYFNNKLFYKNVSGKWEEKTFSLNQFSEGSKGKLLISLYDPSGRFVKSSYIGHSATFSPSDNLLPIYPSRYHVPYQDLTLIVFLITVSCIVFLKNRYPKRFKDILSVKSILSITDNDENTLKADGITFWGLIVINTFAFYLVSLLLNARPEVREIYDMMNFHPDTFIGFLKATGFILVFLLARYLYLLITGSVFKTSSLVGNQFSEFIRLLSISNIAFVLLAVVFNVSNFFRFEFSYIYFFWGIFGVLLIIMLKSSLLIFKFSPFRNFYLISYLCISEILPLFVIIKILININIF
ncbi:DUF4271 domain-containing protein [Cytophagaceae bacterium ABcell3]|nr:DUF4271 domain-containing protein [Cytophagaceae bacterium ABcell3]